jgi:hypothetical protein
VEAAGSVGCGSGVSIGRAKGIVLTKWNYSRREGTEGQVFTLDFYYILRIGRNAGTKVQYNVSSKTRRSTGIHFTLRQRLFYRPMVVGAPCKVYGQEVL